MNISNFKTNYNRVTNSLSSPRFLTTLLLLIVVSFLFNLNFDILPAGAQNSTITGEGHVGYIPKWILATTVSISPSSSTMYTGGSSTIIWSSENATSCTGTNFNTGGATSGNLSVSPTSTTTYTITCSGVSSSTTQMTITVKKRPRFIEN